MGNSLTLEQCIESGLDQTQTEALLPTINTALQSLSPLECWSRLSRKILTPDHPFSFHTLLFETTFADWDDSHGPPPAWIPQEKEIEATNLSRLMQDLNLQTYKELYRWSIENRSDFWDKMIRTVGVPFKRRYTDLVDLSEGVESPGWLVDAELNIAESCFQAPSETIAIVSQREEGPLFTLTYGELQTLINRVANGLCESGFVPGDPIAVDMPMTAESVAIYLGIVKAGCVAVSIADSFASHEISTRLRISSAKAIFTQDHILRSGKRLPLYDRVASAEAPRAIVLNGDNQKPSVDLRPEDIDWETFLSDCTAFEAISRSPGDHTNILFSSGTTGDPKAIPWSQTTPIKCAVDGYLHQNIQAGDIIAWPTNLGWMMGPWLIYASLVNRATIALYDGAPTGREFGRFVQDAEVTMLGVVPSLVRAWRDSDCMNGLDWSAVKAFSSTGEASNAHDMRYLMSLAAYRPVIEYCGGTEIGGGHLTGTMIQPASPATFTTPALGLDLLLINETGQETDNGEIFLIPPSIGLSTELLNRDHHEVYYEETPLSKSGVTLRRHGDQVERLANGYYRAQGRVDDTMNLGGIKVSANEIEQTMNATDGISETAAIAVSPPDGGPSRLVVYAVPVEPGITNEELLPPLQNSIRQNLNPLFRIHDLVVIETLPRTASNKVMRRVLRDEYVLGA